MIKKIFVIIGMIICFSGLYGNEEYIKEYMEIGNMYLEAKEYSEAINAYNEVLILDPSNEQANIKMAELYIELRSYDAAEAFLEKLRAKATENKGVAKYFGDMYLKRVDETQDEKEKNEFKNKFYKYYEAYIKLTGYNDSEAIFFLGDYYFKDKLVEKANDVFIKDRNETYKNCFGAATTYRLMGYYDDAIKYYKKSMKQNPDFIENYIGIGIAYQLSKNYVNAIYNFEKYLEKVDHENVYHIVAKLYLHRNEIESAKKVAEKGVRIFPDSKDLKELMIEIYAKR